MLQSIINLFFPKACAGCNAILIVTEHVICTECRHDLPLTNQHKIPNNEAFLKFYGKLDIEHASALLYFQKKGIVQELIHKLKYKGHQEIGELLGFWYADELQNNLVLHDVDYIIPVPLHAKRLKKRGYNQVASFGKALSESLQIPIKELLLIRDKYTKTQTRKNILDRSESVSHIFSASATADFHDKHFLLIDDVITTGATLESCGKELLKIPGARLSIICMAMSKGM